MLYRLLFLASLVFAGGVQAESEQSLSYHAGCPCRNNNNNPKLEKQAEPLSVACKYCEDEFVPYACCGDEEPNEDVQPAIPVPA